jgi:c-di-GMP-binding flagellar brake protein YcgR
MQDRRHYKRFTVDILGINGKMIFAKDVKILDISLGGISIKADKRMNLGSTYTLKLAGKGITLNLKGLVMWSELSESIIDSRGNIVPIYTAGMQFTDLSEAKKNYLGNFIEKHKLEIEEQVNLYNKSGLRLYIRVQVQDPEHVSLDFSEGYEVKNFSLNGMLIESSHPLEIESKVSMKLVFPGDKSIDFLGRVSSYRQIQGSDTEKYEIGVEFHEISDNDKEIIRKFIDLLEDITPSQ